MVRLGHPAMSARFWFARKRKWWDDFMSARPSLCASSLRNAFIAASRVGSCPRAARPYLAVMAAGLPRRQADVRPLVRFQKSGGKRKLILTAFSSRSSSFAARFSSSSVNTATILPSTKTEPRVGIGEFSILHSIRRVAVGIIAAPPRCKGTPHSDHTTCWSIEHACVVPLFWLARSLYGRTNCQRPLTLWPAGGLPSLSAT